MPFTTIANKVFIPLGIFTIANIQTSFLPKPDLLVVMGVVMVLDFFTGVAKAVLLNQARTSSAYRKTIIKFIQYGGAIVIGMAISYLGSRVEGYNKDWKNVTIAMSWLNNGLLVLIIFIEVVSILENLNEMNPKNLFAKRFIQPMIKILTVKINNNPVAQITVEGDDPAKQPKIEIETKIVKSKNIIVDQDVKSGDEAA